MVKKIINQTPKLKKEDGLANLIGQFGKWQLVIFATVSLIKLPSGWVQMAILFLTPKLTFWCSNFGENSTISGENMTCYDDCVEYSYDTSPFERTIVSEWELICQRNWLASLTQTILQLGILIGSIMFGFLSDRYGRKITFLTSVVSLIAFGFGVAFATDYITFTVLRFFLGVATAGVMVISFVIVMETVGPNHREISGCLFHMPFIIGHMTTPLFAYYYRNWNDYSLAMAAPTLIYLGYFFILTESPRWLLSVGKVEEATKLVKRAAIFNGLPTENIEAKMKVMAEEIKSQSTVAKPNYVDIFKGPLLIKTLSSCMIWMITGLTFYGFNQYISQTSSDPFLAVAAAGAIQVPAILLSSVLLKNFGRKLTIMTFFVLGGICVLMLGVVPDIFWVILALQCIGVSCVSLVATCIYVYTSELFPTVVRNMGMGACSTSMRVGSMIAPFVSNLSMTVPWLPTIIFGVGPIIAALVCILLPETRGTVLPDSLKEAENTA